MKSRMILIDNNISIPDFSKEIIKCEAAYVSWTLMYRYHKFSDIIGP